MELPLKCPTCDSSLVTLWYQQSKEKGGKKIGQRIKSGLYFCRKCKIPLKIKIREALTMVKPI